ncbi:mechanosensitive ion channel family protein [Synechococcus sp. CCY9201]|uniref:mechanosensitive ion channel family protein n=1 Tax=Synechococcus sp. CCY9201 TaxID=174697 RepID=UPI002B20D2D5|nr:mechanosensitive ion channel domain-containing protein [Synechococcus sp. CCY9201]
MLFPIVLAAWLAITVGAGLLHGAGATPLGPVIPQAAVPAEKGSAGSLTKAASQAAGPEQVELDGRPLFGVWSSNEFSAEQRVEPVNRILQQAVLSRRPVQITVREHNNLPVLALDGQVLITVTRRDAPDGLDPFAQAQRWKAELEKAIEQGRRERHPDHVRRSLLLAAALMLLAWLGQRALGWLGRNLAQRYFEPAAIDPARPMRVQGLRFLLRSGMLALKIGLWISAIALAAQPFPSARIGFYRVATALSDSLASPFLPLGENSYSVLDVVVLLGLFVLLTRLVGVLQGLLRSRVLRYTGINVGAQEAVAFVVRYGLLFIGTLVLLQLWGLDLSSLTLFAGVLGVGVGLGLQGITKNFVSGLVIIFEQPIRVGDFVEIGDLQGTVQRVNLRSTEVLTLDRIAIIVPNSEFLESRVVNWSHGSTTSRLQVPLGVAYGSDPQQVTQALCEACADVDGILKEPEPQVFFQGFGDNALNFHLLIWINQPLRQYEIISALNYRIEAVMRQYGITIPFPQRTLHLSEGALQLQLPTELSRALLGGLPGPQVGADVSTEAMPPG